MFSFGAKKAADYFTKAEMDAVVAAIRQAEQRTSGEIRLFVETRCRFVEPIDRAAEVFFGLKMEATEQRNGVLVYLAMADRQFAIFADEGIFNAVGRSYWEREAQLIRQQFVQTHYADGLLQVIADVAETLRQHFPYDSLIDKNELPDDIVFGH
jgi:uncharacterized membrane protein